MLGGQPNHGWQLCYPLWRFQLGGLSIDEMVGPGALVVVRPAGAYLLEFFCSGI